MMNFFKKTSILFLFLIELTFSHQSFGQGQAVLTFNTTQPAGTYVARDQINCLPGSRFTANASSSWTLSVDKNVIASINANGNPYSGYSINSVYTIDKNLPVGSINGNYSVNNGQLNYNIGIPMAPGTAGFMPNLAITYNGSLSDGLLGVGWNISGISKISRATAIIFDQAGYPSKATSPINLDHNDNVYLDGNRLSGLIIGSPANAPTVRLENDNFTEVTEILSIPGNSSSTVNSYSVLTKDGIKMEYGYTADSKLMVTNSAGNSVPLSYYVNKVTDKLGNYYTYEYYNVNGEVAIKEIKYTGNVIAGISPYNSIKFYYDTRQDKNTKYILGNKLNSSFILREIELFCEGVSYKRFVPKYDFLNARTHLTSITEYGADNSSLNPTKFAYDINNALNSGILKASTIPSLPLLADYNIADFDGDGIDDALAYCYTTDGVNKAYTKWELYIRDNTDFGFIKKAESPFGSNFVPYSFYGSISNDSPENGKIIGNFNGDNKQDMLMLKNEGINTTYYPYFSTGSGFVAGPSFVFPSGGAVILADINGDQIPEAIGNGNYAGNTGSLRVHSFLDNTTKFISLNYQQVVGAPYKIMSTIDYDGDGSQELLVELLGNYKVLKITDPWPSNASFNLQTSILDYDAGIDLINPDIENVKLGFGDFNEDGLTDQIYSGQVSTTKLFLRYGTRKHNTFNNSFFSTPAVPLVHALPLTNDINSEFVIADMNNDGKSDIVTLEKNKNGTTNGTYVYITYGHDIANKIYIGYAQGIYFADQVPNLLTITEKPEINIGDFDGDGYKDIMLKTHSTSNYIRAIIYNRPIIPTRNRLTMVTNGFNRSVKFIYATLTNGGSYTIGGSSGYPNCDIQEPISIVSSVLDQGADNNFYPTFYDYYGAVNNKQGKGFLGFNKIRKIENLSQTISAEEYDLNTTYAERVPKKSAIYLMSAPTIPISETISTYSYNVTTLLNGWKGHYATLSSSTQYDYVKGINTTSNFTYDTYRNLLSSQVNVNNGLFLETTTHVIDPTLYGNKYPTKIQSTSIVSQRNGKPSITKNYSYTYFAANGLLNVQTNNTDATCENKITYQYNNVGLTQNITSTSAGNSPRISSLIYDSKFRFVEQKISPLGYIEKSYFDNRWGKPIKTIDITNLETSYTYDGYGTNLTIKNPDNNTVETITKWYQTSDDILGDPFPANNILFTSTVIAPNKPFQKAFYSTNGLNVKTITQGFNNNYVSNLNTYDAKGQLQSSKSNYLIPCANPSKVLNNTYAYDELNRLKTSTTTDGTTALTTLVNYSQTGGNYKTITTTPDGKVNENIEDPTGLVTEVKDNNGTRLQYDYYSNGQLKQTQIVAGSVLNSYTYDICDNLLTENEPNHGLTNYVYDGFGQLKSHLNDSKTYNYTYDIAGRTTNKVGPEGNYNYTYITSGAGLGNISTITAPSGVVDKYYYDALNRVYQTEKVITGNTFTTKIEFDAYNNPIKQTYPSNVAIKTEYNTLGYPTKIKNDATGNVLWQADEIDAFGNYTKFTLGNGLQTQNTYNAFGILNNTSAGSVFNHSYDFNIQNGNLNLLTDNIKNLRESYLYDNLDRLTESKVTNNLTSISLPPLALTYDAKGNILSKTNIGAYKYHTTKANAVVAVQNLGNVISTVQQNITYNSFEKPALIIEGNDQATFTYGADQERAKTIYNNTSTSVSYERYYVGSYEREIRGATTMENHYIQGPSGVIGVYVKETGLPDKMYYTYTDHLGTPKTITNSSGVIVAEQNFDPWGKRRNSNTWDYSSITVPPNWLYRGYTGHEHLPQFSLINMNGRLYDPENARMLNADPVLQSPTNSQNYNKYTYALNNPLKYTDPTGYIFENWHIENPIPSALRGGSRDVVDLSVNPQLYLNPYTSSGFFNEAQTNLWHYNQLKASNGALGGFIEASGAFISDNQLSFKAYLLTFKKHEKVEKQNPPPPSASRPKGSYTLNRFNSRKAQSGGGVLDRTMNYLGNVATAAGMTIDTGLTDKKKTMKLLVMEI